MFNFISVYTNTTEPKWNTLSSINKWNEERSEQNLLKSTCLHGLRPKREYLFHLWGAAEPLALAPRCFQNGLWILKHFASTLSSAVTFGGTRLCVLYTVYCLCQRCRWCQTSFLIRLKLEETGSESITFYFCGLFETKLYIAVIYFSQLSLHSRFFSFKIYKQGNSDKARHEIMLPLSSSSFSTYELWRVEFQLCSIKAADQRVNLSGSWAGNTRQFFKTFWFPFRSLFNQTRKTRAGLGAVLCQLDQPSFEIPFL